MNEVKYGNKFHYKFQPESGFWVSQLPTDPMSATVTIGELCYIINDAKKALSELIDKANIRVKEFEAFLEYHS